MTLDKDVCELMWARGDDGGYAGDGTQAQSGKDTQAHLHSGLNLGIVEVNDGADVTVSSSKGTSHDDVQYRRTTEGYQQECMDAARKIGAP
jgi:hypothetical protein